MLFFTKVLYLAVQAVLGDAALLDLVIHRRVDLNALEVLLQRFSGSGCRRLPWKLG
jgi:hypothetical protein